MRIEHIAFWTKDLEGMRDFYQKYFNMKCGGKYENEIVISDPEGNHIE